MLLHPPSAPSPDPDAFLVDAATSFRHHLAAFQRVAEIIDDLEGDPSCQRQVTALQCLAEQLATEWRRLAGDIIATPARNLAGRLAKAAALRAYLERVGEQGACIEAAWALSLANDELRDFEHDLSCEKRSQQCRKPLKLLLSVGAVALLAAAWRARRTNAQCACLRSQARPSDYGLHQETV